MTVKGARMWVGMVWTLGVCSLVELSQTAKLALAVWLVAGCVNSSQVVIDRQPRWAPDMATLPGAQPERSMCGLCFIGPGIFVPCAVHWSSCGGHSSPHRLPGTLSSDVCSYTCWPRRDGPSPS